MCNIFGVLSTPRNFVNTLRSIWCAVHAFLQCITIHFTNSHLSSASEEEKMHIFTFLLLFPMTF